MHIKRFEAATLPEALAQVKAELGPDALILSTRTLPRGRHAFGLLSRQMVEVQAAAETRAERAEHPLTAEAFDAPRAGNEASLFEADSSERTAWGGRATGGAFEREMRAELVSLRRMVETLLERDQAARRFAARSPLLSGASSSDGFGDRFIASCMQAGIEDSIAQSIVMESRDRSEEGAGVLPLDVLRDRLEARFQPPRADQSQRVRVLVGAPGVGKTTTLAKLAARNEEGERDVAFVSLDDFRLGAVEQLKQYAQLMASPFVEAHSAEDVGRIARRYRGHEILVDTAGRGAGDDHLIAPLAPLREGGAKDVRVELVVDAAARPEVLRRQLRSFGSLAPDRIILSKTDVCEGRAPLVNLLLDPQCPPVAWCGTGQRVPEDLEPFDAGDLLLDVLGQAA